MMSIFSKLRKLQGHWKELLQKIILEEDKLKPLKRIKKKYRCQNIQCMQLIRVLGRE